MAEDEDTAKDEDTAATAAASAATTAATTANLDEETDREFLEFVVRQIVENPDEVEITREIDEMGVLLSLKVSKDDMGKIIGKNGQTAKAIRTLLRIVGSKNNARVNLKIVEPGEET